MNQISAERRLFVYGSMTQGLVHFNKIADFVEHAEAAQIQASAYCLKVGFPVLVKEGQDWVEGELLTVRSVPTLFALLDQFHGCLSDKPEKSLYLREQSLVRTLGGSEELAWVYFLNPKQLPKDAQKILNSDWKQKIQTEGCILNKLTAQQKEFIKKLGQITGRETVPVNLQIYRELMNLELIVDKGRRLALSKFGHEVYRYINI